MEGFKSLFKESEKRFIACIDTCFIKGTVLKLIENYKWKGNIKDSFGRRVNELRESGCLLFINRINEFEIKRSLIKDYNKTLNQANRIYEQVIHELKIVGNLRIKNIVVTKELIDWMLKHELEFVDALLINFAQSLELPFITSERKAEKWKKAYDGVMTEKEFWAKISVKT